MRIYLQAHNSPDLQSTVVLSAIPPRHWEFKGVFFRETFDEVAGKRKIEPVQAPGMAVTKPSSILDEVIGAGDSCTSLLSLPSLGTDA